MAVATMPVRKQTSRHWRDVTGPWRKLRYGLFQTRDGRYRALWSDDIDAWWLIERHPDGEQWVDTFPKLRDLRHHVAGVLEAEDAHADAYMLRHRQTPSHHLIEVVHGGNVHATVTIDHDGGIRPTLHREHVGPVALLTAEFAEAFSLTLAEAAMHARALEATRNQQGGTA